MDFIGIVWLIPAIMAVAALINGVGCRKLGKTAGYISCIAMACTFLLAVGVFFQVKGIAKSAYHGHDDHGHGADVPSELTGNDPMLVRWNAMDAAQQKEMRGQYMFVRVQNPDAPMPWETEVRGGQGGYVELWRWIDIPNVFGGTHPLRIDMAFQVDQLTAIFLLFISFVGSLVFIYATGYMKEEHHGHVELDPGYARFFSYLALFAASMYTLILGANMVVMFIGWEGVGLCSYLLIGYYFDRQFSEKLSCSDAGKKAFVVNRIGDFGLVVGMGLLFWGLGTLDFQEIIHKLTSGEVPDGFGYSGGLLTAAALLLFLGATGKSAQLPLFVWLPDAMAGPTPVSALIHAATMVTAGVYMLARLNVVYMLSPNALVIVALVGAATALIAASIGLTQRGIKKILAYSTVSQLGFMFLAIGVGSFAAGIFHVFTHAFFKACLFLAAGSVIHALHHEEDVFKMGGLKAKMPKTWIAYFVATLAIAGIVPFAGFFSKDEILYMTFVAGQGNTFFMILWVVGVVTAAFTAFYMGRSLFLAFHGKTRMKQEKFDHVHESPISITGVLLVLAAASAVVGLLNVPKGLIPLGSYNAMFHHFLAPVTDRGAVYVAQVFHNSGALADTAALGPVLMGGLEKEGVPYFNYHGPELLLAVFSVLVALGGLGFAWVLYGAGNLEKSRKLASGALKPFWNVSWNGWWYDDAADSIFVRGAMKAYAGVLWFDKLIIDGIVNGVGILSKAASHEFRRLQNGQVQIYGLVMFVGVCLFVLYFALGLWTFLSNAPTFAESEFEVTSTHVIQPDEIVVAEEPVVFDAIAKTVEGGAN